jgi:hypothetical protein
MGHDEQSTLPPLFKTSPTYEYTDTKDDKYGIERSTVVPNIMLVDDWTTPKSDIEVACRIMAVPVTTDEASADSTRLYTPVVPEAVDVFAGMYTRALRAKVTYDSVWEIDASSKGYVVCAEDADDNPLLSIVSDVWLPLCHDL